MDTLSPLDTAFLDAEDADRHVSMAIASVAVVEGPVPGHAEFVDAVAPRLHAVRRTQQRLHRLPFDLGRPVWIDTGAFDADYHIRRTALPAPGDDLALCALVGRVMGQRMDRDRPLWELWVIEGLAGNRWAMLLKLHHCFADGVSAAQLYNALFDAHAGPAAAPDRTVEQPRGLAELVRAVSDLPMNPLGGLRMLVPVLRAPGALARRAGEVLDGLGRMAEVLAPVAPSTLSGPIGQPRRYAVARASLADMRRVGVAFGVTVNDVALTAISMAFRELLQYRGEQPGAHTMRALVPVSVRAGDRLDNQVSVMLPMLPVELGDPVMALREVHQRMVALKNGNEAAAGQAATDLAGLEPSALISLFVRLAARLPQRNIVTVTTNVPGSPRELAVVGRRILEIFPYVPIAVRLRTGVAVLSYCDRISFGITADFDSSPDIWLFAGAVERAVAELTEAARGSAVRA
jgi:diacylglycerol O-acyltransferase